MTILRMTLRIFAAVLAVAILLGLAVRATAREQTQPEAKATAATPGEPPKTPVVPEAEKKRTNPVPDVPEAIESGKSLYTSQCAMCHGATGDGRGDLAVSMKWKVGPFNTAAWQGKRTDGEIFYIMSQGHGDMPAEKRLVDQNKWEIVRYVRTLGPVAAPAPPKK
jgi:mono/diheme cytochrome c family protein